MIRATLKRLFPRLFLKKVFLWYNQIKMRTVDRFLFPEKKISSQEFRVFRELNPFLELHIPLNSYSKKVQQGLRLWTDPQWKQDEYLLEFRAGGLVEPRIGWGMTYDKKLIYPSLGFSRAGYVPRPGIAQRRSKVIRSAGVISLRDTGELNYFHFFNDVLAKLFFARDQGIRLNDFSIVVSGKLYDREFFQYYLLNTWLKDLKWLVQRDELIQFDSAIFCKPLTHSRKYFDEALDMIGAGRSAKGTRRIFVNRKPDTLRYVENLREVEPLLVAQGFEIVDPGSLSFREQVDLFSSCRSLAGIHGAGLTNMMFARGNDLDVLEIAHPFGYIPFHYLMLAHQYGFRHSFVMGSKGGESLNGGFNVNRDELESAVMKMS